MTSSPLPATHFLSCKSCSSCLKIFPSTPIPLPFQIDSPSKHFTLTPAKTTKPKTRRIIGIDADDPRLPPEWKRRIRKWTSEPVTHRFKDVEEFSRYFRSRSNKRHPSTRKRKLKDPQKPEPTFDEVLDRALSQTARTLKRWWHRKR